MRYLYSMIILLSLIVMCTNATALTVTITVDLPDDQVNDVISYYGVAQAKIPEWVRDRVLTMMAAASSDYAISRGERSLGVMRKIPPDKRREILDALELELKKYIPTFPNLPE